jgi:multidrug efflux system membrane fusion protein
VSDTDSRPPSDRDAHTLYGAKPTATSARRKRWIFIVLGVVVLALVLWYIYVVTTPATQAGPGGPGGAAASGGRSGGRGGRGGAGGLPTAVNAAKATQGDMPVFLNELGTATPPATVTVIPQISGQLLSVGFREGQMVKKGQFLAQIDPRPYQQMLLNAQGVEAKDQALLADANLDLKRYQTLLSQDSIARQTVDTQGATVRQDEAQVKADAANVAQQKLNLIYCHITSPVAGRVGLRQVDPGNYVTAGTTNGLVVVTVIDPMDVLFTIPEDNLPQVSARMRAGAVLPAAALDRSQTTQLAMGKLFTLDNQVDTTTGTIRAKARFDNADGALFPNQFVNIRLTVDTLHNVVIVPTSAILKGPNGMFVYAVEQSRTVTVTPVKVGPAAGENSAILSGLEAGDVVVTDGSDRLKEGARVMLPGDCIPAGGRGGYGRQGAAGAGGASSAKPKTTGGFFGLFAKPAPDPMAAMRCKPGEHPSSLLSGGGGGGNPFALSFGGGHGAAAPAAVPTSTPSATTTTSKTVTRTTTETAPATQGPAGAAPAAPQAAPAPAEGGGGGHGGGRGNRMQAMLQALDLDPAQQEKAKTIFAAAGQQAQSTGDFRAAFQGAFAQLDTILRPDQKAKLAQLRAEEAARRAQREAAGGGQSDQ